jgi:hypothetical protein
MTTPCTLSAVPLGRNPIPIVHDAGSDPGPVSTGAKNFVSTGILSSGRPARNESIYRLCCLGPTLITGHRRSKSVPLHAIEVCEEMVV